MASPDHINLNNLATDLEYLIRSGGTYDLAPNLGADVLDRIEAFLARFIVYPNEWTRHAHALWIAHCWLMDCWYYTPRLLLVSPEPNCGKGTAFRLTKLLVPRPETIGDMSVAAFYSTIDEALEEYGARPTILYDQIDTVFGPQAGRGNAELRNLIDIGFDRSMTRRRKMGKRVTRFSPFAALGMTGAMALFDVPSDIRSRSVVIQMQRKAPPERLGRRDKWLEAQAAPLRDLLQMWIEFIHEHAFEYLPEVPEGVSERDADMWEPLLAVAELAGGHWPETARAAAVTSVTSVTSTEPSEGILLLGEIQAIFDRRKCAKIFTNDLLAGLRSTGLFRWTNKGPIPAALELRKRLIAYGVDPPKDIRIGQDNRKGYHRAGFEAAWASYLEPVTPVTPVTLVTEDSDG
jgi:Protein of unknown function (DUF3631)